MKLFETYFQRDNQLRNYINVYYSFKHLRLFYLQFYYTFVRIEKGPTLTQHQSKSLNYFI